MTSQSKIITAIIVLASVSLFTIVGCSTTKPVSPKQVNSELLMKPVKSKPLIAKYFSSHGQSFNAKSFYISAESGEYIAVNTPPKNGGNYTQGAYLFHIQNNRANLVSQLHLAGGIILIPSQTIVPGLHGLVVLDKGTLGHSVGSYTGPYSSHLAEGQEIDMVYIFNTDNDQLVWRSPDIPGSVDLIPLHGGMKSGLAVQVVGVPFGANPKGYGMDAYTRDTQIYQWLPSKKTMDTASIGLETSSAQPTTEESLGFTGKGMLIGQTGYLQGPDSLGGYGMDSTGSIYGYSYSMPYIPSNSIVTKIDGQILFNLASFLLQTENVPFGDKGIVDIWSYGSIKKYSLESIPQPLSWDTPLLDQIQSGPYGLGN